MTFLSLCFQVTQIIRSKLNVSFHLLYLYSLLSLLLANNTTNHLDTQTINLTVPLCIFLLSHLLHVGIYRILSCAPFCLSHCHCFHSGYPCYCSAKIKQSSACPTTTESWNLLFHGSFFHAFFVIPLFCILQATSLLALQPDLYCKLQLIFSLWPGIFTSTVWS